MFVRRNRLRGTRMRNNIAMSMPENYYDMDKSEMEITGGSKQGEEILKDVGLGVGIAGGCCLLGSRFTENPTTRSTLEVVAMVGFVGTIALFLASGYEGGKSD